MLSSSLESLESEGTTIAAEYFRVGHNSIRIVSIMVQSLIQRIRENKLDALYLFINESLRDRNEFDVFFHNLMVVLPNNWSINRVEIGHEFLSRTVVADQEQAAEVQENNNDENDDGVQLSNNDNNNSFESKQDLLFRWVCSLESLRSLIISDGYIPRKDNGFVDTKALLRHLPLANNLQYLDIQRLKLRITGEIIENNDAELLAESLDSLRDSLEDLRLTAISICDTTRTTIQETSTASEGQESSRDHSTPENQERRYPLDATIRVCGEMANLQLLAISCASGYECHSDNGEDQQQQQQQVDGRDNHDDTIGNVEDDIEGSSSPSSNNKLLSSAVKKRCFISRQILLQLCRSSSTLQELALRNMLIDDDTCKTIAKAFDPPGKHKIGRTYLSSSSSSLSLLCSDSEHDNDNELEDDDTSIIDNTHNHSPSFWTSLDLRQNPSIGTKGYEAILSSLERNYDLWCSLMVDNDSFQSRFNALIELNQANRGALVRSPTPEKLAIFLDRLKDDPTALWYFLTIHRDSILHPLIRYLKFKNAIKEKRILRAGKTRTIEGNCSQLREQQQHQLQVQEENKQSGEKRSAEVAMLLPVAFQSENMNGAAHFPTQTNAKDTNPNMYEKVDGQSQRPNVKRTRHSTEAIDESR